MKPAGICCFVIGFLLLFPACREPMFVHGHYYNAADTGRIRHVISTERFGDSEMIITEKRWLWRKYIRHFIDVRGLSDDSFDNSFTIISRYKVKRKDTTAVIDGKKTAAKKILIESYRTEFSEGKKFYFITAAADTFFYFHEPGCIR